MNTLRSVERNEFSIYQIEHDLALSDDEICNDFERMLEKISEDGRKPNLLSSIPSLHYPAVHALHTDA